MGIKEENMQIKVIERSQEIAIQAQEIDRREKELESSIRKPAEAEKYKLEKMAKEADAWKEYKEAAMIDMMLQTLPKVAAEVAAPLSQAKKITMVSDGSGEVGAARITGEVLDIMVKVPTMVNKMTGVDVTNSLSGSVGQVGGQPNRIRIR